MEVLVTGGTGRIGTPVVQQLQARGTKVRVLTRGRRRREALDGVRYLTGDLAKDEGVRDAVDGVDVVVHCAASIRWGANRSQLENLIRAAKDVGVRHLVSVSVVGADRVPTAGRLDRVLFGYFRLMVELEKTVSDSGLAWSIQRATQFYEAILLIAEQIAKLPVLPVPTGLRFQPVDTRDVAIQLVELALGEPAGLAPDVAGPRTYTMEELIRSYLRAAHKRRPILPIAIPGKAARAVRDGAILAPGGAMGQRTWEAFLAERGLRASAA